MATRWVPVRRDLPVEKTDRYYQSEQVRSTEPRAPVGSIGERRAFDFIDFSIVDGKKIEKNEASAAATNKTHPD